jgi:hypothetical protein
MKSSGSINLFQEADAVFYLESSLAPGMTIGEYRRSRPRPTRWERLKQLAGGAQVAAARPA